jgi:hypothetical protein
LPRLIAFLLSNLRMKTTFLFLFTLLDATAAVAQPKQGEMLLLGTFHFHNPGLDIAKTKTFDVMTPKAQAELETITQKISVFHPDKIFVEWGWDEQKELDELYTAYLGSNYQQYIITKYPKQGDRDFYLKNEIVQLAFRAGKKAKLTRIYALDYGKTSFPFDSVMKAMQAAHQEPLMQRVQATIKAQETSQNQKIATYSLTQLLLDANTPANLAQNKGFYIDLFNRAGTLDNFAGAFLVSEWYRRNLYMYALVQKTMTARDGKALVLVGSGHAAMMREFVASDQQFRLKEFSDVLK